MMRIDPALSLMWRTPTTVQIGFPTPVVIAELTPAQAATLSPEQVKALADAGLLDDLADTAEAALGADSLDQLTPAQIAALPVEFIDSLAPSTAASLSPAQVAALTAAQAATLSPAHLKAMAAVGLLDALADTAEAALLAEALDQLSPAQIAALSPAQLAANSPALGTVALRPHLIWGPNDPQLTARVLARGRTGRLRLVDKGLKLIDSIFIDNAVDAHILALERIFPGAACAGKAYFITQGEPMAQRDLINGMLKAGGLPPCEKSISAQSAYVVGVIMEIIWKMLGRQDEPMMTRFVAKQLSTAHWYNISAAKRDLGYEPKISVAQGLQILEKSLQKLSAS